MAAYAALASLARTTDLNRIRYKFLFSFDAEEKVRSIHDYVKFLILFFEEFPEKVNRWEIRIRDVSYKIEDIIDVFTSQQIQSRHRAVTPSRIKLEDQLENAMEEIGLLAGEVMEERPAYLPASSSSSRIAAATTDAVIGLDDDLMAMKDRLCGLSTKLQVMPIVGMGGIGKTTLARTIYNDSLIMRHFEFRAWVVVSQDYNPLEFRKILLDSMKLLGQQVSADGLDESEIALRVYRNLKGRRYLIVIDDVWRTHVWDDVRYIFPDDNNGSRIMLTTRQLDVANYPYSAVPQHEMRFMDDSQSWDLLKGKVFANSDCPHELEDVGKEIARRCAGLPLAIVLVGGVLSSAGKTRASWEEIARNVKCVAGQEIEKILSLSYIHLPHHLRPCFLFIGGFVEVNICTSRLIRLWVAEGFLKHQNGCSKSWEEMGEEYLEDLVKRNLLIVTSRKSDGKIKRFSLHDMVRDLCKSKAHNEKFLHVVNGCDLPQGLMNERRISFSPFNVDNSWAPTCRTILCFQIQNFSSWLALLGICKLLRVLDVLGVNLRKLPSQVFELYHLRYLALMGSFGIPSTVSNLVNLQTLIIHPIFGKLQGRNCDAVLYSLPIEIWSLPQLRHLLFHAPYMLPHPLGGLNLPLEHLQTLLSVANLVWNDKILRLIPNVKRLGLTYTTNQDHRLHHLNDLQQLEKLTVIGYLGFSWRGKNPRFPCTLKKFTLVGGKFPWKDMAIVGSLPNLEILKLLGNACEGETWETTEDDFPQLTFLLIDDSYLRQWISHSNSFRKLKYLVLHSCWNLTEIPEGIGEIPTLELIEVDRCKISLVESAKKIKEDQESYGNFALQVRVGHEEIQSSYKWMNISGGSGDQVKGATQSSYKWMNISGGSGDQVKGATQSSYKWMNISDGSGDQVKGATSGNDAVIGLDDDLMAVKERLCGQSSNLEVIPIVGIAGIGKTTLTRTVYEDRLILEHFHIRIWLTASQYYGPHQLQKILLDLVDSMKLLGVQLSRKNIDESELKTRILEYLVGRRYLLVMDNLQSTKVWDDVRSIFPDDGNGSRIMLTTRQLDLARYPDTASPFHEMRLLNDSQSWDLLKQKTLKDCYCPPNLEDVGEEIARRCAGLPLAIVLVAGFLSAVSTTRASWEKIVRDVNLVVDWGLKEILSLSYSHLPCHMRLCFLFIGVYAKHGTITASELYMLWPSRTFLMPQSENSKILEEEEAEEYLEDLVKRNLLAVNSWKSDGKIKRCQLHDLVQEFSISKACEESLRALEERLRSKWEI